MTDSLKCLVTGVAGFMGSHVASTLIESGYEVVGVDDLSGGFEENVPANCRFYEIDISDVTQVQKLYEAEGRFDRVFHLAAYAAEGLSHYIRRYNYTNNVLGSINLINKSIETECDCFVFTSSIAVYGAGQVPLSEATTPMPEDPYGVAKYAVELDLKTAHDQFGMDYIVFRPHNVYGRGQNIADRFRNVIGIFMNQLMKEEPMTVFGDGQQTRAFTYIDDVAPVIAMAPDLSDARNKAFNIGADKPYTVLELGEIVAASYGSAANFKYLPARNEVVHAHADHTLLKQVFDYNAKTDLAEGVSRMSQWAKATGPRESVGYDEIEVTKNFPEGWKQYIKDKL